MKRVLRGEGGSSPNRTQCCLKLGTTALVNYFYVGCLKNENAAESGSHIGGTQREASRKNYVAHELQQHRRAVGADACEPLPFGM